MIVPVPLHPWRLWRRRYNQAAELARRLAADTKLVKRSLRAAPQPLHPQPRRTMTSARARRRNVQRAFVVPDPARIAGRRILLVDDVADHRGRPCRPVPGR